MPHNTARFNHTDQPMIERQPSILIVDENANERTSARDYLQRAGMRVRVAPNPWEAQKLLQEAPASLVIAGVQPMETSAGSLREHFFLGPETRDVPFVFLLPKDQDPGQQRHILRNGVDDCIQRPFDPVVLVARVQAALERQRNFLQMIAIDPLTRLLNPVTLENRLQDELKRALRYRRPAALLLLDIDGFRRVNQEHGAEMGDLLLTCAAGVILSALRSVDIAGRLHGDHFLLFLPETPCDGGEAVARRIRERLSAIADNIANLPLAFNCGLVPVPDAGDTLDALLAAAKTALEKAQAARNGGIGRWTPPPAS